jgi:thiamine pyrophosphokinase
LRTIIFANGDFNRPTNHLTLAMLGACDLFIAADGGAHHAREVKKTLDVVIGDLDSITANLRDTLTKQNTEFIVHPRDKDETDLELALKYAIDRGSQEILLLGLLGGRLDQTLANLLLLTRQEWSQARLLAADGPDIAVLLKGEDAYKFIVNPGDTISLIPLSSEVNGVATRGLRWVLEDATLKFGSTLGVSNETTGETAWIEISNGQLLVVHRAFDHSLP